MCFQEKNAVCPFMKDGFKTCNVLMDAHDLKELKILSLSKCVYMLSVI